MAATSPSVAPCRRTSPSHPLAMVACIVSIMPVASSADRPNAALDTTIFCRRAIVPAGPQRIARWISWLATRGAGVRSYDADHSSSAITCGSAQAYHFAFETSAWFDADAIARHAVDLCAPDGNGDFLPDQAACNAATDGTPGFGIDLAAADFTATCVVGPASAVVPAPGSLAMISAGLGFVLGCAGVRRRFAITRRGRSQD